ATNSAYVESRQTRRKYPVNWAFMNPQDMRDAGVADGTTIEIVSESGRLRGVAKAEAGLRRGVVSMTHMFGPIRSGADPHSDGGSNVGQLTSLERWLEPVNYMPRFSGIPVNVRPVRPERPTRTHSKVTGDQATRSHGNRPSEDVVSDV
nr:molybdopterin dinucleotide binding domain-containing protein [Micromonospora sp. DSM 115978]